MHIKQYNLIITVNANSEYILNFSIPFCIDGNYKIVLLINAKRNAKIQNIFAVCIDGNYKIVLLINAKRNAKIKKMHIKVFRNLTNDASNNSTS
jgi:hypothetical protein